MGGVAGARSHSGPVPRGGGGDRQLVPWIGFPVGYAVSGVLLTVFGYFAMVLSSERRRLECARRRGKFPRRRFHAVGCLQDVSGDSMNHWSRALHSAPDLAIFLVLGIGFWIGSFKYRGFGLGSVTGSLFAGIIVGQFAEVPVSPVAKSILFLLFLFGIGYSVGPQIVDAGCATTEAEGRRHRHHHSGGGGR